MQTEEEMKDQLLEAGLNDAVFEPGDGRRIERAEMERLCRTLAALEDSLLALERRGISLRAHAARRDPVSGRLPIYHVFVGHQERWFTTRDVIDAFLAAAGKGVRRGIERRRSERQRRGRSRGRIRGAECASSSSTKSARSTTSWPSCGRWASRSTA